MNRQMFDDISTPLQFTCSTSFRYFFDTCSTLPHSVSTVDRISTIFRRCRHLFNRCSIYFLIASMSFRSVKQASKLANFDGKTFGQSWSTVVRQYFDDIDCRPTKIFTDRVHTRIYNNKQTIVQVLYSTTTIYIPTR